MNGHMTNVYHIQCECHGMDNGNSLHCCGSMDNGTVSSQDWYLILIHHRYLSLWS